MSVRKKRFITAIIVIFVLAAAVVSARFVTGGTLAIHHPNLKYKGPKDAPVHLIIYSDFQCPACRNAIGVVEGIRNQFPHDLKIEFRHFPLEQTHVWAVLAATFAECAAEQNKFWAFHDQVYLNQDLWSRSTDPLPIFASYVKELNLDTQQFEACVQNPETLSKIRREHALGVKQGVQSTPTILINNRILVGSLQLKEQGPSIITEELNKIKSKR